MFRGSFLLCCMGQLMTGVTTAEADITQLLGCSTSDWAGVRAGARSQGRVSVRARRQVRGVITLSHVMSVFTVQTQQQSSLTELVTRCEAEAGVCWVRGRLVRSQEAGQRLHIVRVARPSPAGLAEIYEKHL